MTGTQLAALIRKYTKTTSATYSDADMLPDVNNVKNEIAAEIIKRDPKGLYFLMTALQDLVASSVTAREYALPDDVLSELFTVEASLGSSSTDFVPVLPFVGGWQRLVKELNGVTEAKITGYFSNQAPQYVLTRRGIYILSGTIAPLSGGLKYRYRLYPADLANLSGSTGLHVDPTTTSFGLPLQFHELWGRRVSIIWKSSRPKPIPLSDFEKNYEVDLEKALDSITDPDLQDEDLGSLPKEDSASILGANV